ncbi:VOC family protein [Streptomyces fructofermentans]|uniref:VOC family protein n=1 Tax=Streptomyces fructofermentans TaxID=152141 RepID=UPI0033D03FE3
MASRLFAICINTPRPPDLARFWAGVLGRERADGPHGDAAVLPADSTGLRIRFVPSREPRAGRNRAHFDLTSTSPEDQRRTVARALELGGCHIDVGQLPEEGHVVLADPDGNEFCVSEPGNEFLAGTGAVGALACDGTRDVGLFWSEALRWPLVWDQDQETAIQAPDGGTKISWGGPPIPPKTGANRLYLELAVPDHLDPEAETDRLVSLGATHAGAATGSGGGDGDQVFMLDPDGNEFSVRGIRRRG